MTIIEETILQDFKDLCTVIPVGLELTMDFQNHKCEIYGFGYKTILHKDNYMEHHLQIDKQKELWYNRWIDAFYDELEENAISNGKR